MKRVDLKVSATRTVRFAEVVRRAGTPELIYLWTDPAKDRRFQAAIRQQRVMTLRQPRVGAKKDFGIVGFHADKDASYLLFPKPLTPFQESRIIGIKYELLKDSKPSGRRVDPFQPKPGKSKSAAPFKPYIWTDPKKKLEKAYRVTIRFQAVEEVTEEVVAKSRKAAEEIALREVKAPSFTRIRKTVV